MTNTRDFFKVLLKSSEIGISRCDSFEHATKTWPLADLQHAVQCVKLDYKKGHVLPLLHLHEISDNLGASSAAAKVCQRDEYAQCALLCGLQCRLCGVSVRRHGALAAVGVFNRDELAHCSP